MATAPSSSEGLAVATWGDGTPDQASKSDRYLARRLAEASADFKSVAFTTFLLGASVAAIGWLACGVLLEHWIVPGGLPAWARWVWLGTGAAALVAGIVRWLVPLIRYRVNLVYAARALEAEHPELHNDLVNTVLVKARGGAPGPGHPRLDGLGRPPAPPAPARRRRGGGPGHHARARRRESAAGPGRPGHRRPARPLSDGVRGGRHGRRGAG